MLSHVVLLVGDGIQSTQTPLGVFVCGFDNFLLFLDQLVDFFDLVFQIVQCLGLVGNLVGFFGLFPLLFLDLFDFLFPALQIGNFFFFGFGLVFFVQQQSDQGLQVLDYSVHLALGFIQLLLVQQRSDLGHLFSDQGFLGLLQGFDQTLCSLGFLRFQFLRN